MNDVTRAVSDSDDIKHALADAVLAEFVRRDLTQAQAAALLGVKQSRVSEIATRRFRAVSVDRLLDYAERLGMSVALVTEQTGTV